MPVLDTEVLLALNPTDRHHKSALKLLGELRKSSLLLYAPDTAILEFQAVLRSLDKKPHLIRRTMLGLLKALQINGVTEASTTDSELVVQQCEIEAKHGLTFFDSLIAASTLRPDSTSARFAGMLGQNKITVAKEALEARFVAYGAEAFYTLVRRAF